MNTTQSLSPDEVRRIRLQRQGLTNPAFQSPNEVVSWLGAVQSQEFQIAKWTLGQRSDGLNEETVATAIDEGLILRTQCLRPTWHFVARDDIRWILKATSHRVHQLNAFMYRQLDLEQEILLDAMRVFARVLEDGVHRTRPQLNVALEAAGIKADGLRLAYFVMYAELEGLICSGRVQGKQQTYALIDERAPNARILSDDEALAELARRYVVGHGPVSVKDLAGWASLTLADARRGIAFAASDLEKATVNGIEVWLSRDLSIPSPLDRPVAHLVQCYDEYVMGYFETRHLMVGNESAEPLEQTPYLFLVLIDGVLVGHWKRTIRRTGMTIEIKQTRPYSDAEGTAVESDAARMATYYGLPFEVLRR